MDSPLPLQPRLLTWPAPSAAVTCVLTPPHTGGEDQGERVRKSSPGRCPVRAHHPSPCPAGGSCHHSLPELCRPWATAYSRAPPEDELSHHPTPQITQRLGSFLQVLPEQNSGPISNYPRISTGHTKQKNTRDPQRRDSQSWRGPKQSPGADTGQLPVSCTRGRGGLCPPSIP